MKENNIIKINLEDEAGSNVYSQINNDNSNSCDDEDIKSKEKEKSSDKNNSNDKKIEDNNNISRIYNNDNIRNIDYPIFKKNIKNQDLEKKYNKLLLLYNN